MDQSEKNVFIKAYELGEAISASSVCMRLREAEEAARRDAAMKDALDDCRRELRSLMGQVNQILEFVLTGEIVSGAEMDKMDDTDATRGVSCDACDTCGACEGCGGRV